MSKTENQDESLNPVDGAANLTSGANFINIPTDAIGLINGSTTTSTFVIQCTRKVEDVQFIENEEGNFIEIIYSESPNYSFTSTYISNTNFKTMVKERYGVAEGKLKLIKTIRGTETPGYYVPATTQWEE